MKKSNVIFIIFSLMITIGCLLFYTKFLNDYGSKGDLSVRVIELEKELEKERVQNQLLVYQLKDFQQSVAAILSTEKRHSLSFFEKNLSDSVRMPASDSKIDLSTAVMEKGKKYFSSGRYDKALVEFRRIKEKYPLSPNVVEAQFFIAESLYLKADYESSLVAISEMVDLYPENTLTGFILLRMGQISQVNEQSSAAREIYKTVIHSFNDQMLKDQAKKLYEGVVL